jgi:hypothetical protein
MKNVFATPCPGKKMSEAFLEQKVMKNVFASPWPGKN